MNVFSRVRCTASTLTSVSRRINCKHLATVSSDQDRAVDNCTSLIKLHDFDSYLSGILLPKKFRGPYFAVRAFHVELALIKDQCRKNVLSGRMRFQYWRETIDQVFSVTELTAQQSAAQPPIARALRSYVNEFNLPQRYFERAIDARQQELNIQQHETLDEMEDFAENTHASILYILLNVFGGAADEDMAFAASHVGVCSGMVTQLRGMAHLASQSEIVIPAEVMRKHSLGTRPILNGPKTPEEQVALQDAVFDVASQAHGHLEEARKLVNKTSMFSSRPGFLALMPAVRSQIFLEDLRKVEWNPFHPDILGKLETPNQLQYQFYLLKCKSTNRI